MPVLTNLSPNQAPVAPSEAKFPKPLFIVHHMEPGRLFTADCGALTGSRRFDIDLQTFVQHTGHYTLEAVQRHDGMVSCAVCLALGVAA